MISPLDTWQVFSGFDKDSDGQLDFEEFTKIAKILC